MVIYIITRFVDLVYIFENITKKPLPFTIGCSRKITDCVQTCGDIAGLITLSTLIRMFVLHYMANNYQ